MIYVIESGDYFKVGFSGNLDRRFKQYNTHNPSYVVIQTYDGDMDLERHINKSLQEYLLRGEWFNKFEGCYTTIDDIVNNYCAGKLKKTRPYKNYKYEGTYVNPALLDLPKAEYGVLLMCVSYYGYIKNSGHFPNKVELNPRKLSKGFKVKRETIEDALKGLVDKDFLRMYGKTPNMYSLNPKLYLKNAVMHSNWYFGED